MDYNRFIRLVQERARFDSAADAVNATSATLQTLAERIGAHEAADVAAQLPRDLRDFLKVSPTSTGQRFSLNEFRHRVAQRETGDESRALGHAQAVIATLEEAISGGEISEVIGRLPPEYLTLFASASPPDRTTHA